MHKLSAMTGTTGQKRQRLGVAVSALALLAALATALPAQAGDKNGGGNGSGLAKLKVVGLTKDGRLVQFLAGAPGRTVDKGLVKTSSQTADRALIGIDFRVQDGKLYGVGDAGGLFTIDPDKAIATPVPAPIGPSLDVAPSGVSFGVDFNPAANALRIVSDTGQNLRHPFGAGPTQGVTQNDGALTYAVPCPVPPGTATALGVIGAAYTNNDDAAAVPAAASTGTTLLDLDSVAAGNPADAQDQVAIQSPANQGCLAPTGSLGVDAGADVGFDIFSLRSKGVAVANAGFASLVVNGKAGFYSVNLVTGKATLIGNFKDRDQVVDIAVPVNQ
jgi:hypothetical protein